MKTRLIPYFFLTRISPEADYFREGSFLSTAVLAGIAAWLWIGQTVTGGKISPGNGLLLFALVGLTGWLIYKLHREHYFHAVLIFLAAQLLFIAGMMSFLGTLDLGYLFLFTVFIAGSLVGPAGAFAAATLALLAEFLLLNHLSERELFPALALLQYLAALISGQAAQGLYSALQAAERLAQEAREHAEEARQHRGELHRTLKSLDMAYLQLERINGELIQARATADAALNFKKEFIAQTSHELRTPLNLIIGFSETMAFSQNSYGVKLPPPYLRDVTEIHRNSRHLLSLIDDILDLSKLESGRMGLRFSLVEIREVFQEVRETIQPLTQAKGLELTLEIPETLPRLWLDRARIHQVLLNLLSNAARLTKQGGIHLRAEFRENQNDLLVQVRDSGPGITEQALLQIFEEFQQTNETRGQPGTTGLGLTISQRIVELHGGRLWVESTVGVGSTFSFALPVYMPVGTSQDAIQTNSEQIKAAQPSLILLSEEDSEDLGLLQRHLDGYVLTSAPSWEAARQLVEKVHARAIITGWEPAPDLPAFPIPIITCPLPSSQETAAALGVDAYLRKPLTIKTLRNALRQSAPEAKKLLLVDEDTSALRLVERMALGLGKNYQLFRAYDGNEALARLSSEPPDAILLDLGMAGSRKFIEQAKGRTAIPILALSSLDLDENIPARPIRISKPAGFTATEILGYLQALLAAAPPAKLEHGTSVPPSPAKHPA
jgi:signal transduction histidine kinase/CheY-like chemotaxis protein